MIETNRLVLHEILVDVLGSRNVYYQPPENIRISYPAIVYSRDGIGNVHANNNVYKQSHTYTLTVIDRNPDSDIVDKISKMPNVRFNRHYVSNNLNHDVFTISFK